MKRILLFISFFLLIGNLANAQNRANIWELSYSDTLAYPDCGISFNSGSADTFTVYRTMAFFCTDAGICDTNGNLLFCTNGVFVANKNNDTLLNSANFDTGWATTFYASQGVGLGIDQGAIIIPCPGKPSKYYIFYVTGEPIDNNNFTQPLYLSYSMVDMNLDGGLGGIVANQKNIRIINDTLTLGRITAVKHANGRDWWVIIHRFNSDEYYKLLVTPDSIYGPYTQDIGSVVTTDANGQAVFSPDGSKFAMISQDYVLDYMNFDRCTGDFYNYQLINVPNDTDETVGCSFSPSGRFLYVSSRFTLWQYDTWASDINSSVIKIAVYDSFVDIVQLLFFMHQLAPDGKIYMSTWNGSKYLHIINSPDSLGLACNFTQHSFKIPQYNNNIPGFPNYDLGAVSGSACDTLNGIAQLTVNNKLSVYPNPASSELNITYSISQQGTADIVDMLGRQVMEFTLYPYNKSRIVYLNHLPSGIYELHVTTGTKELVRQFVKE